jgi:hypothetical protein
LKFWDFVGWNLFGVWDFGIWDFNFAMSSQDTAALIAQLNAPSATERLSALASLVAFHPVAPPNGGPGRDVNNHIHTTYSFSPYSPAKAVWMARQAGLVTAGIMDHDSVGGAREFIEAGRIAKLPITVGAELRVSLAGTPFEGRRANNPDQDTVAYVALHGIPHSRLDAENGLPLVSDALNCMLIWGRTTLFSNGLVFRRIAAKAIQPLVLNYGPCRSGHQGAPGFAFFDPLPDNCR